MLSMHKKTQVLMHPATKPLFFFICLVPLAWLVYRLAADQLGANPSEALIRSLGIWALRFLCLTLAITPLRYMTKQAAWVRFRRMLGVFTFFYASLHFLSYVGFDQEWLWADIWRDILKRPFILVGTLSLFLMLPLALTSFNRAIKALGGQRWQRLHRLVYGVALLTLLHFFWMRAGKQNFLEVGIYGAVIAVLLLYRLLRRLRQ
jgi:methionine sulfoxide reductase heme-binding subunit